MTRLALHLGVFGALQLAGAGLALAHGDPAQHQSPFAIGLAHPFSDIGHLLVPLLAGAIIGLATFRGWRVVPVIAVVAFVGAHVYGAASLTWLSGFTAGLAVSSIGLLITGHVAAAGLARTVHSLRLGRRTPSA